MLCAPSSTQCYMDQGDRTSGLCGTTRSFVLIHSLCPALVSPTSTGHSFRDIWMKFCRHITLGGHSHFSKKMLGSDHPGENFFPIFFSKFRPENLRESCPRKTICKKRLAWDPLNYWLTNNNNRMVWNRLHSDEFTWIQLSTFFMLNMGTSLETLRLET